MVKNLRIHKFLAYVFVFTVCLSFSYIGIASNAASGELIEISQLIQDPNGIGVVLKNDISSFITESSFFYLLIALYQSSDINGFYIVGFNSYESSILKYKLGGLSDNSNLWFESNSSLILNYGSIIYLDILDYLVAFGTPINIEGLAILSQLGFSDIELNINNIVNDFQDSFIPVTTTLTSPITSSISSFTSQKSQDLIPSIPGFEYISIVLLSVIIIIRKKLYNNI